MSLSELDLEQKVRDDTRSPGEKLGNQWSALCCDRTNAFNEVA
jgi:hypothetical protein